MLEEGSSVLMASTLLTNGLPQKEGELVVVNTNKTAMNLIRVMTLLYTHRRPNLLSRKKLHQPAHLEKLREEQSLLADHNRRSHLEDMIASLLTRLQVYFRRSVRYAA